VRGDSLRDFYAKTFVVLGLGVLAAGGALVDYWPSNGELPSVSAAPGLRRATPQLAQDLAREIPAPVLQPAIREIRIAETTHVAPTTAPAELELTLPAPPPAEPIPADFILGSLAIDVPVFVLTLGAAPIPEPVQSGPAPEGIGDRVTDVLKRTRDTIKDARSSLRGAFSGVLGAVRRANPFFNSNATSFR
jgi:hypothetical protein